MSKLANFRISTNSPLPTFANPPRFGKGKGECALYANLFHAFIDYFLITRIFVKRNPIGSASIVTNIGMPKIPWKSAESATK
jgi:hypothetical protein